MTEKAKGNAQDAARARRKKVNFNKPFIITGAITGVLAAAPYTQLANYVYGIWGLLGGILAAYLLSRQYRYFTPVQGGVLGTFSGFIATGICVGATCGLFFADFPLAARVYPKEVINVAVDYLEPVQIPSVRGHILPIPKSVAERAKGGKWYMWLVVHGLYVLLALVGMSIIGGIVGAKLFGKKITTEQRLAMMQRRKARMDKAAADAAQPPPESAEEERGAEGAAGSDAESAAESSAEGTEEAPGAEPPAEQPPTS